MSKETFRASCQSCKHEFPLVDSYSIQEAIFLVENMPSPNQEITAERHEIIETKRPTIIVRERAARIPWVEIRCPSCHAHRAFYHKLNYPSKP